MANELEEIEDLCYDVIHKLVALCVVVEPVESIMYTSQLANEALYAFLIGMTLGMMEPDTIGDAQTRLWLASPMGEWVPWANAIRDELGFSTANAEVVR